jgi:guanidinoacetate N-methyltransferase
MRTIKARTMIGFPSTREDWNRAPARFGAHALRIAGHPVMEDWEAGYMTTLARIATSNGGSILEIGYGLGLATREIQAADIKTHWLVECHPDVIDRCLTDLRPGLDANRLHVVSGFWQEVTPMFRDASFDGILFHTYPLSEDELHSNHFSFSGEAFRLLRAGGVLTYYSDEAKSFSPDHLEKLLASGFAKDDIAFEVCAVSPPAGCEYWESPSLLAPVITKR